MARKTAEGRIRVQVGEPWPEDVVVNIQQPSATKKDLRIAVQVGEPWPEDIKVDTCHSVSESSIKTTIIKGFYGLITLILVSAATYGWFYSEEIFKDILGHIKYISFIVLLWAIGPKVGSKIIDIAKAIAKAEDS